MDLLEHRGNHLFNFPRHSSWWCQVVVPVPLSQDRMSNPLVPHPQQYSLSLSVSSSIKEQTIPMTVHPKGHLSAQTTSWDVTDNPLCAARHTKCLIYLVLFRSVTMREVLEYKVYLFTNSMKLTLDCGVEFLVECLLGVNSLEK